MRCCVTIFGMVTVAAHTGRRWPGVMNTTSPTLQDQVTREKFRSTLSQMAKSQIGVVEKAGNDQKYGQWFGLNRAAWCAIFVSWVYNQASVKVGCENPIDGMHTTRGFSSTVFGYAAAKLKGLTLKAGEPVLVGDIIVWKKTWKTGHTGIVVFVSADGWFEVVEGNTSKTDHTSRNGGEVALHRHTLTDGKHGKLLGIIRPTRKFTKPRKLAKLSQ